MGGLLLGSLVTIFSIQVQQTGSVVPSNVQSMTSVPLLLFATSYVVLLGSASLLVWAYKSDLLNAVLIGLVSTVALDFWQFHAPFGLYEDVAKLDSNSVIAASSHIGPVQGPWPSLFIQGSVFNMIVAPQNFLVVYLLIYSFIFGVIIYSVSRKFIPRRPVAFLAALLAIEGNVSLAAYMYHPDILAIPFILVLLISLVPRKGLAFGRMNIDRPVPFLIAGVVAAAISTLDLIASVIMMIFFLVLFVASILVHGPRIAVGSVILLLAIPLLWSLYWGAETSSALLSEIPQFFRDPLGGLSHVALVYSANVQLPAWLTGIRLAWIVLGVFLPMVIAIWVGVRNRRDTKMMPVLLILAVTGTSGLTFILNGINSFTLLLYVPLLGFPILLAFLAPKRITTVILIVLAISFASPSFFAFSPTVQSSINPPQEVASAHFNIRYFTGPLIYTNSPWVEDLDPSIHIGSYPGGFSTLSGNDLSANQLSGDILAYLNLALGPSGSLLQYQQNFLLGYYHLYGEGFGAKVQTSILTTVDSHDVIYSNGYDIESAPLRS